MPADKFDEMARECADAWHIGTRVVMLAEEKDALVRSVAALMRREVEKEREACAAVVDDTDVAMDHGYGAGDNGRRTLTNAAAAIRARGERGES